PKSVKRAHHYVPQFWMRGFADTKGEIHAWDGGRVRRAKADKIMQVEWLYTVFDHAWNPSDAVEDGLGKLERIAAQLFVKLAKTGAIITSDDRRVLCEFLALQACRHPDVMKRGRRALKDLIALIALSPDFADLEEFVRVAVQIGVSDSDARALHVVVS